MLKVSASLIGPHAPGVDGNLNNFGLANQLFQVAAVLSYAYDNNFEAIFPILRNTKETAQKYRGQENQGNYSKNIFRNLKIYEDLPDDFITYSEPGYGYHPIPSFDQSFLICGSLLQSELYFKHNRNLILDSLAPSNHDLDYIHSRYGNLLKENTVSLHVRRGDYLLSKNAAFPEIYNCGYYDTALNMFDHDLVLVFSDDIEWCKEYFKNISNIYFISENTYLDLYIMSMCKNNIIANSTFSWWGAWLNKNPDKKVISPHGGFGHQPLSLIPEEWIKVVL
jgi:hypothetical protein